MTRILIIAAIVAVSIGGWVTLFKGEPPVHDDVALAVKTLVQPWEGRSLKAYPDPITHGKPWTICDGDTLNIKPGMVETPAGCDKRTVNRMERDFRPALVRCIAGFDKKPIAWRAMMNSLAWNIGSASACNSTAARLGRSGQYLANCNAATAFNKAGGRIIIGLVKRREMGDATRIGEGELCIIGGTALIDGIADRRVKSALNGYVALTEKTAADARAAREKQLREAAERQLAAEQARAVIAEKAKADSDAQFNKMIEDDRANSQDPADYWNDRELDWLRHH